MSRTTKGAEERARHLHDRATRGNPLSAEERAELEAWYAQQDRAESALLAASAPASILALQAQVDEALGQLSAVTERIQELSAQNDTLRRETSALQRQLAQVSVAHSS